MNRVKNLAGEEPSGEPSSEVDDSDGDGIPDDEDLDDDNDGWLDDEDDFPMIQVNI